MQIEFAGEKIEIVNLNPTRKRFVSYLILRFVRARVLRMWRFRINSFDAPLVCVCIYILVKRQDAHSVLSPAIWHYLYAPFRENSYIRLYDVVFAYVAVKKRLLRKIKNKFTSDLFLFFFFFVTSYRHGPCSICIICLCVYLRSNGTVTLMCIFFFIVRAYHVPSLENSFLKHFLSYITTCALSKWEVSLRENSMLS